MDSIRRLLSIFAILVILVMASVAHGQASGQTVVGQGLDPDPIIAEPLGMRFHPPAGASFQYQRVGEAVTISLVDGNPVPAWTMRVQTLDTDDARSPALHVQELLTAWRRAGRSFEEVTSEPRLCGGAPAHLCYVETDTQAGKMIQGWLVVAQTPRQLLTFAMQIEPGDFAQVTPLLDASFASAEFFAPDEVTNRRRERIATGKALLARFTPERLRALIGTERWFRYYLPTGEGNPSEKELGYYEVSARAGMLGEIDPNQPAHQYDPAEREEGLLVRVGGHYLQEGSDLVYDSEAFYWLAWDRSHEAWSIRGTHRQGEKTQSDALTGIRTPATPHDPRGTITVIASNRDGTSRDQQTWKVPEVYLSQATRWVLPLLLVGDGQTEAITFSTYCFDHTATKLALSLRIDEWVPTASGFQLTSRTRSDAPVVVSDFDPRGRLVRRVWSTGPMSVAIEPTQLERLWKRKGLTRVPTGR